MSKEIIKSYGLSMILMNGRRSVGFVSKLLCVTSYKSKKYDKAAPL